MRPRRRWPTSLRRRKRVAVTVSRHGRPVEMSWPGGCRPRPLGGLGDVCERVDRASIGVASDPDGVNNKWSQDAARRQRTAVRAMRFQLGGDAQVRRDPWRSAGGGRWCRVAHAPAGVSGTRAPRAVSSAAAIPLPRMPRRGPAPVTRAVAPVASSLSGATWYCGPWRMLDAPPDLPDLGDQDGRGRAVGIRAENGSRKATFSVAGSAGIPDTGALFRSYFAFPTTDKRLSWAAALTWPGPDDLDHSGVWSHDRDEHLTPRSNGAEGQLGSAMGGQGSRQPPGHATRPMVVRPSGRMLMNFEANRERSSSGGERRLDDITGRVHRPRRRGRGAPEPWRSSSNDARLFVTTTRYGPPKALR